MLNFQLTRPPPNDHGAFVAIGIDAPASACQPTLPVPVCLVYFGPITNELTNAHDGSQYLQAEAWAEERFYSSGGQGQIITQNI